MARAKKKETNVKQSVAVAVLQSGINHMVDRATTYDADSGERSMEKTVDAFNVITGRDLSEEEGWLLMIMLKAVRSQQGDYREDSYEDGAAYFGLMAEAANKERA